MTQDTVVTTQKAFSDSQTMDMTDEEIKNAFLVIVPVIERWRAKHAGRFVHGTATMDDFERAVNELEDEIKTRSYEIGLLVTVNPETMLEGQGPQIEFLGKIPLGPDGITYQDHEKKTWEVQKSKLTGEDYLGQDEVKKLL